MEKLDRKKLTEVVEILFESQYAFYPSRYLVDIDNKLSKLYKNHNIQKNAYDTSLIKDRDVYSSPEKKIIDKYKETLINIFSDKIDLWSDDFWDLLSINLDRNFQLTGQLQYTESSSRNVDVKYAKVLSLFAKEDVNKNLCDFLSKSQKIYKVELNIFHETSKKTTAKIPDFILNYPETTDNKLYTKLKYISKYNNEEAVEIAKKLFEKINGSLNTEKAIKILSKMGVKEESQEAPLFETYNSIYYKQTIQINPLYFIQKYNITPLQSKNLIESFYDMMINKYHLYYSNIKSGYTNDLFKNSDTYIVTCEDLDNSKVLEFNDKFIKNIRHAGEIILDKTSDYCIFGKHYSENKSNRMFLKECVDIIEKVVISKEIETSISHIPLKDASAKKLKI